MWEQGLVSVDSDLYKWEAKIFKEPSRFGLKEDGRISKLFIWKKGAQKEMLAYDRFWVTPHPKEGTMEHKIFKTVLAGIDIQIRTEKEDI